MGWWGRWAGSDPIPAPTPPPPPPPPPVILKRLHSGTSQRPGSLGGGEGGGRGGKGAARSFFTDCPMGSTAHHMHPHALEAPFSACFSGAQPRSQQWEASTPLVPEKVQSPSPTVHQPRQSKARERQPQSYDGKWDSPSLALLTGQPVLSAGQAGHSRRPGSWPGALRPGDKAPVHPHGPLPVRLPLRTLWPALGGFCVGGARAPRPKRQCPQFPQAPPLVPGFLVPQLLKWKSRRCLPLNLT